MLRVIEQRLEIEVYVGQKGHVCLKQIDYPEEDKIITLHPDDVTKLIVYLKEAQAEAYLARASLKSDEDSDSAVDQER
jgi:hypothetical protein